MDIELELFGKYFAKNIWLFGEIITKLVDRQN